MGETFVVKRHARPIGSGQQVYVQEFVDGEETNHGWLIRYQVEDDSVNKDSKYDPSSDGTEADRPYLDIDWTAPAGGLSIPVAMHHYMHKVFG